MLGACLLIVLGIITQEKAIHGIDFNTIGLLVGMMAIVTVCQKTGMFQYLAIKSAKFAGGEPWRILVYLSIVTAVLSALLDNVTTVLLIAPITLLISDELNLNPYPFLVSQILASNIGGAATLIGDPPNIMIGSAVGLSFMDFLLNAGPVMPVVMVATFIVLKFIYGKNLKVSADRRERIMQFREADAIEDWVYGKNLKVSADRRERIMQFREADAIEDWVLLKKCLLILTAVIAGFVLQEFTHVEPATTALFGAALLLLISGEELHDVMGKVEWTTIFFFIGLFIVVHGMVEVGLISMLANLMLKLTGDGIGTAVYLTLWVSAIASALVDNIPFVATMIPLIKDMGPSLGGDQAIMPLWWALSIGACLGGNGSIIGASANVIVAGFAARSGYPIGFFRFMKLAFPLMLMSIVISTVYIYLRFL
jgi:Na+/H+ antiporter NhaD/arsenite permease-like protein